MSSVIIFHEVKEQSLPHLGPQKFPWLFHYILILRNAVSEDDFASNSV